MVTDALELRLFPNSGKYFLPSSAKYLHLIAADQFVKISSDLPFLGRELDGTPT